MIILITGASHTGKTLLAQRLLEKYKYPYLSIDHLKMGLIRSGQTALTPMDDEKLTEYLWPIVREMIKTAVENRQNLIVEGCYIPFAWRRDFDESYLASIRFVCLALTEAYIDTHFAEIRAHASDIEARLDDSDCTALWLKTENRSYTEGFKAAGETVTEIDADYEAAIEKILRSFGAMTKDKKPAQFMDCFAPMPIVERLSDTCWGAAAVGARDQGNGLEDRTMAEYSYWDGAVMRDEESGKFLLFASRWEQKGGHWGNAQGPGWLGSQAVYAESDSLFGPYTDLGPLWPDWCEGAGHNVFPFPISPADPLYAEGYRYAICISDTGRHEETANGTIHLAKTVRGPWTLLENENGGRLDCTGVFSLSNVSIVPKPEGGYLALDRHGDLAQSDALAGKWQTVREGLWKSFSVMENRLPYMEDGVIWHCAGTYHIVVNDWDARQAYCLTSPDGLTWTQKPGLAYTPTADFLRYENGAVNRWTKIERPNVYIEDGKVCAMTFAVIDVQKEDDLGNDDHGSKVIVVPFDGEKLLKIEE